MTTAPNDGPTVEAIAGKHAEYCRIIDVGAVHGDTDSEGPT